MKRFGTTIPLWSAVLLSVSLALTSSAAAAKTLTRADVKTIVTGMGYETTGEATSSVIIENQGKNNISLELMPVQDGAFINIYTPLGELPADKVAQMPAPGMLAYNDRAPFYFSYDKDNGLYLQARVDSSTITAKVLRERFDGLIAAVDETRDLWDQSKWTGSGATAASTPGASAALRDAGGGKTYQQLLDEADAAWERTPMAIKTAVFAKDRVPDFGEYQVRSSTVFKYGETVHAYVEPVFFDWKADGDQQQINLSADVLVKTASGSPVIDSKKAIDLKKDTLGKTKTVYMAVNINLEDSLATTDYILTMTVHDNNSAKVASVSMPFSIVKP